MDKEQIKEAFDKGEGPKDIKGPEAGQKIVEGLKPAPKSEAPMDAEKELMHQMALDHLLDKLPKDRRDAVYQSIKDEKFEDQVKILRLEAEIPKKVAGQLPMPLPTPTYDGVAAWKKDPELKQKYREIVSG